MGITQKLFNFGSIQQVFEIWVDHKFDIKI